MPAIIGSSRIPVIGSVGITGPRGPQGPTGGTGPTGEVGGIGPLGLTGIGITGGYWTTFGEYVGGTGVILSSEDNNVLLLKLGNGSGSGIGDVIELSGMRGAEAIDLEFPEEAGYLYQVYNAIAGEEFHSIIYTNPNNDDPLFDPEPPGITKYFKSINFKGKDLVSIKGTDSFLLEGNTSERAGETGALFYLTPSELGGMTAVAANNTYLSGGEYPRFYTRIHNDRKFIGAPFASPSGFFYANNNLAESVDYPTYPLLMTFQESEANRYDTLRSGITFGTYLPGIAIRNLRNDSIISVPTGSGSALADAEWTDEDYAKLYSTVIFGRTGETDGVPLNNINALSSDPVYIMEIAGSTLAYAGVGSCCWCTKEDSSSPDISDYDYSCGDYTTKSYCDLVGGEWQRDVTCFERPNGCGSSRGVCCVNGKCVSSTKEKCEDIFSGYYVEGYNCQEINDEFGGCPNFCEVKGACCVNGDCLDLTEGECALIDSSLWFPEGCDNINCCLQANYVGACCVDEFCYDNMTPYDCKGITAGGGDFSVGVFHGIGSTCIVSPNRPDNRCVYDGFNPGCYFEELGHGLVNTGEDIFGCCTDLNAFYNQVPDESGFDEDQFDREGNRSNNPDNDDSNRSYLKRNIVRSTGTEEGCFRNPLSSVSPGEKFGGGTLVGFIGQPGPIDNYSGMRMIGSTPKCIESSCESDPNNTNGFTYFLHSGYNGLCFCDHTLPMQVSTNLNSNDPFGSYKPEMLMNEINEYGGNLGSKDLIDIYMRQSIYGTDFTKLESSTKLEYKGNCSNKSIKIHRRWALVVADEDIEVNGNKDLEWGMSQSAGSFEYEENRTVPLPAIGTCPVDGLLNTRMFDNTSIERANWFKSISWKQDYETSYEELFPIDDILYKTFDHTKQQGKNNGFGWGENVSSDNWKNTNGSLNIEKWRSDYSEMWEINNPIDTAIKQISMLNDNKKLNDKSVVYSDWYIPSVVELGVLFDACQNYELNTKLLFNGGVPLTGNYWSSTTANKLNKTGQYKGINPQLESASGWETEYDSEILRSTGHAHSMIYQDFSTGKSESTHRRFGKLCSLRPVRRVPVYIIEIDTYKDSVIGECSECESQDCKC